MTNVLLVVPAGKEPQRAVAAAIEMAKQRGGTLVVLAILDPSMPAYAASTLTDLAFMGEEVTDQVSATIAREYRTCASALLHAVTERAKKEGVAVSPLIEQGDTGDICRRVIRTYHIGITLLVAEKRSWLTRLLSHRAAVQMPVLPGCEVRVMEED
jgi:nucleotide-binding universal stress UspA family protein